jgi:hypothetical protein
MKKIIILTICLFLTNCASNKIKKDYEKSPCSCLEIEIKNYGV